MKIATVALLSAIASLAPGCNSTAKRDAAEIEFLQKRVAEMERAPVPYSELSQRLLARISKLPDEVLAAKGLYRVQPGDTLAAIAKKYGVRVRELAIWNVITDPVRVRAGDILIVSEKEPNQRLEPTPTAVTPAAGAAAAPAVGAAHH